MLLSEMDDKAICYIFEHADVERMYKWEKSFFESVEDQWMRNRRLSDRQKEVLGQIWDKQP